MNDLPGSRGVSSSPFPEKRTVPRYSLVAAVEIIDPACGTHFYAWISEVSREGCYMDILNPVTEGTLIHMLISRDKGTFMAAGKVVHI
jgi:hypothetical protein